jgi:hypothetical protein
MNENEKLWNAWTKTMGTEDASQDPIELYVDLYT